MRKNIHSLLLLILCLSLFKPALASSCHGELYGINAGRGEIGLLFKLDEENNTGEIKSIAKFSSAALSYDTIDNRFYYVSAPRSKEYKLDVSKFSISDEAMKHLPIQGKKFKYTMLAYYDINADSHHFVGRTKRIISMVYDPNTDSLLGHDFKKLYKINKVTGDTTELADISSISDKFRGDLVLKNNELLLVGSKSIYKIDQQSYALTKLSEHGLSTVTGATLNRDGDLIVSRTIINDLGHVNKSTLHKVNPISGNSCRVATLPMRINDLASNTSVPVSCYEIPLCETDIKPSFTLTPVVSSITEGGKLSYKVELSGTYYQDVVVDIAIEDVSTTSADYSMSSTTITFSPGQTSATIEIQTNQNTQYGETKSFNLKVTAQSNAVGEQITQGNILNDDPNCVTKNYTRIYYSFVTEETGHSHTWGITVNGQYIKLLREYGGSGSYDILQGTQFSYALAINGSTSNITHKYRWHGNTQQWEDWHDNDWNDFVVNVSTQTIPKQECN